MKEREKILISTEHQSKRDGMGPQDREVWRYEEGKESLRRRKKREPKKRKFLSLWEKFSVMGMAWGLWDRDVHF